jgi:uncharacterized membrane protein
MKASGWKRLSKRRPASVCCTIHRHDYGLRSKGFMLHCFGKVLQAMMESKSYITGQAPKEEGKRPDTFGVISSGTNTGIMYATGSAVIGSAVAGPVGAAVGAIVGAIVGGYIGSHKIDNQ